MKQNTAGIGMSLGFHDDELKYMRYSFLELEVDLKYDLPCYTRYANALPD
jgi:hypothetical protein